MEPPSFRNKFDWIRAVSDPNSGLTSTQHHVALALTQHLNIDGKGYVTHARLALDTRMSERSVSDALTALADQQWMERTPGTVGRATTYVLTRKPGWHATPAEQLPKRPRRRLRDTDNDGRQAARDYLAGIYAATGANPVRVDDDTVTGRRLIGVIRRHLRSLPTSDVETDKVRSVLADGTLATAIDPAAVLLARYKKALRLYPHLRPVRTDEVRAAAVQELIAGAARALSLQRHHEPVAPGGEQEQPGDAALAG